MTILRPIRSRRHAETKHEAAGKFKALLAEFYSDFPERLKALLFGLTLTVKNRAATRNRTENHGRSSSRICVPNSYCDHLSARPAFAETHLMFMGHLGIALGAKGFRRDISLTLLCLAAVGPDLVDFALEGNGHANGAGLWTHSLLAMLSYAAILFAAYAFTTHNYKAALVVGLVAASHVLVDLITSHMILWQGGPPLGLHLYLHRFADLLLESAVVLVGWLLYLRTLPGKHRVSIASVAILLVLLAMQGVMATMKIS